VRVGRGRGGARRTQERRRAADAADMEEADAADWVRGGPCGSGARRTRETRRGVEAGDAELGARGRSSCIWTCSATYDLAEDACSTPNKPET
jgi:hypothetical protein